VRADCIESPRFLGLRSHDGVPAKNGAVEVRVSEIGSREIDGNGDRAAQIEQRAESGKPPQARGVHAILISALSDRRPRVPQFGPGPGRRESGPPVS
jgi:hypothetical protein